MRGVIKRLVYDRAFGFITADGGGDYFFHRSGFAGDFDRLEEGLAVSFELGADSGKGPRAEQVQLAASLPAA